MKTLPGSCLECRFYRVVDETKGRCLRHAPGVAREEEEITQWPFVPPWGRCGIGEERGEPISPCHRCVHWFQPTGEGIQPRWGRHGKSEAWWEMSALCARFGPSPGGRDSEMTYWRVTHAQDSCGDGKDIEFNDRESIA